MPDIVNAENLAPQRRAGADLFRYLMAFAVVLLHALPFQVESAGTPLWAIVIATVCRAAVPFFFVASGYFLRIPASLGAAVIFKPLVRLLPVYLFWMAFYYAFVILIPIQSWSFHWGDLARGGVAFHLWFLPALGFALLVVTVARTVLGSLGAGLICLGIAITSLLIGAYHEILDIPEAKIIAGTLSAPLLVYAGTWLAIDRPRYTTEAPGARTALAILLAIYCILFGEEMLFSAHHSRGGMVSHYMLISTFALGIAMFGTSMAAERLPPLLHKMSGLGRLSLGIYASHLIFIWAARCWIDGRNIPSTIAVAIIAFACANAVSLFMGRVAYLKIFVR